MKIESQVCSLELSERLKSLGIKQESQFYYCEVNSIGEVILKKKIWCIAHISQVTGLNEEWYSAFISSELSELLPGGDRLTHVKLSSGLYRSKFIKKRSEIIETYADSEADCKAKLLIKLIEMEIVKNE